MREDTDVKRQSERDQRWEPGEDTDPPVKALEDTPLKTQRWKTQRWEAHENTGGEKKDDPQKQKTQQRHRGRRS